MKVAGLYLWSVSLSRTSTKLWITTRKMCVVTASKKTKRFLASKKGRTEFGDNRSITGFECCGTIDA